MGRTVSSFRNVIEMEKREWKTFRNALDKSERKSFDEMWDIPRLYLMACSNSCQLVPFHPIVISILFHHYKELVKCEKLINKLTEITNNNNNNDNDNNGINDLREGFQNNPALLADGLFQSSAIHAIYFNNNGVFTTL
jgi:hypothetical protein